MDRKHQTSAFTIVELLIVIVVIAVLAAISIVAYNGIRQRAQASTASNAASQVSRKIKFWQVENPGTSPANLAAVGISDDASVSYQYTPGTNGSYCVTATSGSASYRVTESQAPSVGGCAGHGQNGVAAITNLVVNPSFESNTSSWLLNSPGFSGTSSCSQLANGFSGTRSLRCSATSSGTTGSYGIYQAVTGLSATSEYTLSAYVRSSISLPMRITAERRNSSNANIGNIGGSLVTLSPNTWTRLQLNVPATPTMDRLMFTIYTGSGTMNTGDSLDFDAIMMTEGSTLHNYADGNSPNWVWNNTANNSTSTGPAN